MKKDKESIFLSGIELAAMGGITLYILKLFINYNEFINKYIGIAIGVVAGYYLIKALVIVIKKIKEGKCSNTFLIQINEHDYIVIIDKNSSNTIFSHNIDCRFCTNNNLFFYPYSCSVLDGYNSKMMDTHENIKK